MVEPRRLEAPSDVYIPPDAARFVVVSDIDDTVMVTGVVNKAAMLWRLFVQDAEDRTVFPGVSHLYRALHAGGSGDDGNPMLYVSRAPGASTTCSRASSSATTSPSARSSSCGNGG